jgi:Sugar (and other) transporter
MHRPRFRRYSGILVRLRLHSHDEPSLLALAHCLSGSFRHDVVGLLFWLPVAPRWLYAKGRYKEGDEVVCKLHNWLIDDLRVQHMRNKILASIKLGDQEEHTFNPLDLTWDRSDLRGGRRIRISFMVLPLQEMMEINLSVYYSTVIFSQARLSPFLPQLLTTTMNTGFVAGTFFLPKTIERVSKRGVLIRSLVVLRRRDRAREQEQHNGWSLL